MTLGDARRRAVLSLPWAVDRGRRHAPAAATSCRRRPLSPSRSRSRRFGIDGAMFTAEPDPETNFKLFGPVRGAQRPARERPSRAFALRLRPNQDFAGCLEAFCRAARHRAREDPRRRRLDHRRALHRWRRDRAVRDRARDHSGRRSRPAAGGALEAQLDVALIDYTRRHCGGPADPRRQSRADDHGAGARGVGLVSASDHQWSAQLGNGQECGFILISPSSIPERG